MTFQQLFPELSEGQRRQLARVIREEVIGPDVEPNAADGLLQAVQLRQNALKEQQRAKLAALLKEEES